AKANAGQVVHLTKVGVGTINFNSDAVGAFGWNNTTITQGTMALRPTIPQTVAFGTGTVTLNGGTFAFNAGANGTFTLANNFATGVLGGTIDFTRSAQNPAHVMAGNIQLGG